MFSIVTGMLSLMIFCVNKVIYLYIYIFVFIFNIYFIYFVTPLRLNIYNLILNELVKININIPRVLKINVKPLLGLKV